MVVIAVAVGSWIAMKRIEAKMKATVEIPTIYTGVFVNDIDVSGKTKEQALKILEEKSENHVGNQKIRLVYHDKTWELPFSQLGVKYDIEKAAQEAWDIGRSGELKERYKIVQKLPEHPVHIEVVYSYDEKKVLEELTKIAKEFRVDAQNSVLTRKNGTFVITDEENGYEMNIEATKKKVITQLKTQKGGDVEIVIQVLEPKITREQNEKVTDLIGSFSTHYTLYAAARNENLRVGCKQINGTLLGVGEVFSMNEELGPQTYENGYKDAGVYVNGKVEQGVGGGVCQVTSTLYNAAIFAELDIVQRSPHSMTVGYVPLGRDAAIAGDYKDLKFKNNTDAPVYIEAYTANGTLVTNIYGHEMHSNNRRIEFEKVHNETIDKPAEKVTEDPELPEGTREITSRGKTGCKVTIYKKIYENGKLISREWFSSSTYRATPDQISVGTKKTDAVMTGSSQDEKVERTLDSEESGDNETSNLPPIGSE